MRRIAAVLAVSMMLIPGCAPLGRLPGEASMIRPSGLRPIFPSQARCPGIASPFGSQTRYDGSSRPTWLFGGYHGGIDISLAEGTPLLALAAGTVVSKGQGGQREGIYLWLRHSPEDTGLPYWVYSKYQHLQSLPELAIGARVAVGEVFARSGRTGTVGGHYGSTGYPHLHLTTRKSASGDQIVGSRGETQVGSLMDPLLIYRDAGITLWKSVDPALREDEVIIPYATPDGQVRPAGTRIVWPIACEPVK
jgi:murein DD-endopeptidase MepM/ murein hydrolase activator NlpD